MIWLGGEVVADLGQEVLDLLRREVVDGDGLQQILGRYEASLPPLGGDGFLDLVQGCRGFVAIRLSPGKSSREGSR